MREKSLKNRSNSFLRTQSTLSNNCRGGRGETDVTARRFEEKAKNTIQLMESWKKYQTKNRLKDLVLGVHQLSQIEGLKPLLSKVPHRNIDPTSKTNLANIIEKVSRYRDAARLLYRSAKKFPIIRNMVLVMAQLPEEAFRRMPIPEYKPVLASVITRFAVPRGQPQLDHICRLLEIREDEANERFARQTVSALKEAKIHAEVQLLFYSQLNSSSHPPRVVCSSKDTCFLCNTLFSIFKKVHTPRCHGKIYPGWRLPHLPVLPSVQNVLNDLLSKRVSNSHATLLRTRRKTVYPDPNESALLTVTRSASTLQTEVAGSPNGRDISPLRIESQAAGTQTVPLESIIKQEMVDCAPVMPPPVAVAYRDDDKTFETMDTKVNDRLLIPGEVHSADIKLGALPQIFEVGPLEVQVEYSGVAGPSNGKSSSSGAMCNLEWITQVEANVLMETNALSTIDINSLEAGVELAIENPGCFYIAARGAIVRLQFNRRT